MTARSGQRTALIFGLREWPLWRQPRRLIATLLVIELGSAALVASVTVSSTFTWASALRAGLLLGLGIVFEEAARVRARLRWRLIKSSYIDMTSVWIFACASILQPPYAVVLALALNAYLWLRHQRHQAIPAFREVANTGVIVIACVAASVVAQLVRGQDGLGLVAVVAGIATYLVVNQLIVLLIVCANDGSLRHLRLPDMDLDDNILEIATLCLGGLTGLAVADHPALAVLAVLPTFALQRGAIVRELEVAASHDAKTGLLNAVAWQHVAKNEIARASREAKAVCIMIIDLDFFKLVNDTYGHLVGDVALRAVGDTLRRELREYDTVGRFGGEEFVIVLPGSDEIEAALVAERLRQQVGGISIASLTGDEQHTDARLSSSIGVACYPAHGEQIDQLLIGADAALYKAKQRGRNRVEFADGGGGSGVGEFSLTD